jgi:hypothetical protein
MQSDEAPTESKEEEFFEFVQRDARAAALTEAHVAFTPAEAELGALHMWPPSARSGARCSPNRI